MKISEAIAELERLKNLHGDIELWTRKHSETAAPVVAFEPSYVSKPSPPSTVRYYVAESHRDRKLVLQVTHIKRPTAAPPRSPSAPDRSASPSPPAQPGG